MNGNMNGVHPMPANGVVNESRELLLSQIFKKRECNRFRSEICQGLIEICQCGYSKSDHSFKALQNESEPLEPLSITSPTDAFGKLDFVEDEEHDAVWKNKQYVRLDHKTDVKKFSKLHGIWKMAKPDVIFSVISDSDCCKDNGSEVTETKPNETVQNIKNICSNLVETAASTNAWIITGGLNKGVDQLIGNEVKQRLAKGDKAPQTVLGISNWGCLEEKKDLLNHSRGLIGHGSSLNQHHTHFLLVDDGTQKNSGCERKLRKQVEFALKIRETNDNNESSGGLLFYILTGGNIKALRFVKRALAKKIPVIIATGTGGAADIIFANQNAAALEYLPEIVEKPFNCIKELLVKRGTTDDEAQQVIAKIKAETKLDLLFEIVELLSEERVSKGDAKQFGEEIAKLEKKTTNELLVAIKELLSPPKTPSDNSSHPATNAEPDKGKHVDAAFKQMLDHTVIQAKSVKLPVDNQEPKNVNEALNRAITLHAIFHQMLVVNGIPKEKAKEAVDNLDPKAPDETLAKVNDVLTYLKKIREYKENNLLIKFDIMDRQKKSLTNIIVQGLKEAKRNKPSDLYMLVADWDTERHFRQLLQEKWMRKDYENVFRQLLFRHKTKYVKLMMEYISNCSWLTKPDGPLEEKDSKKNKLRTHLLRIVNDPGSNEDKRLRIKGKYLFIWCIQKQMPETAMFFWKQGQNCLAMALLGYCMSKEHLKKDDMEEEMEFFSKVTVDFLRRCYADNRQNTHALLVGKVEDLNDRTPLEIADRANFNDFLFETPIQELLDEIWIKDIKKHDKHKYFPDLQSLHITDSSFFFQRDDSAEVKSICCNVFWFLLMKLAIILSTACPLLAPLMLNIEIPGNESNVEKNESKNESKKAKIRKFLLDYFPKFISFVDTPRVKFTYGFIFYIAYLTLFSIVLLTDFRAKISPSEIALSIWTFILITEEIVQASVDNIGYLNIWNYLDIGAIIIYVVGFILRMIYHGDPTICPDCLYVARIVLAFSLIVFFCRTLEYLSIYESLGPKIFMIRRLVADLIGFLLILAVFISAYGVASNVILYPNQPLNGTLLHDVFYDAWWSVIQQFNREDAAGLYCNEDNQSSVITAEYCSSTSNDGIDYEKCKANRCPANNWIVTVLLAFYALLTCIMLLNVLIAMFNVTFTVINEKQKAVSKMQRYRLLREYCSRSMVPPPFCVITYPYYFIMYFITKCKYWQKLRSYWLEDEDHSRADNLELRRCLQDLFESPPVTVFAKNLDQKLKTWEHRMAEEFFKENRDKRGWSVPRMESETSDNFHNTLLGRYIMQNFESQMRADQVSEENDSRVSGERIDYFSMFRRN